MSTTDRQEQKFIEMTTTPVNRLIARLAAPTIICMLTSSIYNMADTFFVGQINTQSTAAVGISFSVMAVIQAIGFFFGHGSGNYISRKLGSKEMDNAETMASTGFAAAFLIGVVLAVFGYIFSAPLAVILGSTPTVLPYAVDYLRIIFIGAPFIMSSFVINNQLRFQGKAASSMIGVMSGGIINIGLDPLFIFKFEMGVAGAALATIISQFIGFVILLVINQTKGTIKFALGNIKFNMYYLKEIARGGFPSLCRQGLGAISTILLNHSAGLYGDAAIAGMSIVTRIMMFAGSVMIGFGQGFQPVCGYNYGAKLYSRVRKGYWFCVQVAFVFLTVIAIIMGINATWMVEIFRKGDPEVTKTGITALRLQCISLPLSAFIVTGNMMLQSIGKATKASIVAMARQGIFLIPALLILPKAFGLLGVQMSQAISDVLAAALTIPITLSVIKEMKEAEKAALKQV